MTPRTKGLTAGAGAIAIAAFGAVLLLPGESAQTADHLDPPSRTDPDVDSTPDRPADIADIFAWVEDDNLNLIMTFAGPAPTTEAARYDRDVLYRLHISTDGDPTTTERLIRVRFGQDGANEYGVQATGVPALLPTGVAGTTTISGPVNTDLSRDGVKVRAGLFDDPFFFDLQGFMETKETGDLSIMNNRDAFANANDTAFVIQIPAASLNATGKISVWGETQRYGGQL